MSANVLEGLARASGRSPLDVLEFFLERAAIREYDAGMKRSEAESAAMGDVRRWLGLDAGSDERARGEAITHASSTGLPVSSETLTKPDDMISKGDRTRSQQQGAK